MLDVKHMSDTGQKMENKTYHYNSENGEVTSSRKNKFFFVGGEGVKNCKSKA